jgi:hypothetical protein
MQHTVRVEAPRARRGAASSSSHARPERAWILLPVGVLSAGAIVLGWLSRDEQYLVPDSGLGYWLGPVGLSMMVLLLTYSIRKRWRPLRSAGVLRKWFHAHMVLGLVGPTAILFHTSFHLGSLNAKIALVSMLVVSASGIVGRFIYTRIHYEYQGRILCFSELQRAAAEGNACLSKAEEIAPEMARVLRAYEKRTMDRDAGWASRAPAVLTLGHRSRAARRRAMAAYRQATRSACPPSLGPEIVSKELRRHIRAVRRVGTYAVYERAFALWHAFHLPVCFVLFASAAIHVVAVHMY